MGCNMSFAVQSLARTLVTAGAVFVWLLSVPSASAQQPDPVNLEPVRTDEDLYRMQEYFEANPHLMEERGSGWNPFNRSKWFYEARRTGLEIPGVGDRWRVWARVAGDWQRYEFCVA